MRSVIVKTGPTPITVLRPHPDNPNEGDAGEIARRFQQHTGICPVNTKTGALVDFTGGEE